MIKSLETGSVSSNLNQKPGPHMNCLLQPRGPGKGLRISSFKPRRVPLLVSPIELRLWRSFLTRRKSPSRKFFRHDEALRAHLLSRWIVCNLFISGFKGRWILSFQKRRRTFDQRRAWMGLETDHKDPVTSISHAKRQANYITCSKGLDTLVHLWSAKGELF